MSGWVGTTADTTRWPLGSSLQSALMDDSRAPRALIGLDGFNHPPPSSPMAPFQPPRAANCFPSEAIAGPVSSPYSLAVGPSPSPASAWPSPQRGTWCQGCPHMPPSCSAPGWGCGMGLATGPCPDTPAMGNHQPCGTLEISAHHTPVQQTWTLGFRLLFGLTPLRVGDCVFSQGWKQMVHRRKSLETSGIKQKTQESFSFGSSVFSHSNWKNVEAIC